MIIMMRWSDYKELTVWQKSVDLAVGIYDLVKLFPSYENYALSDQMRRAAVSIPSNIAEGYGRNSEKEFIKFLNIARGSLFELETQLEICHKIGYASEVQTSFHRGYINEISKMINSLVKYRLSLLPKT